MLRKIKIRKLIKYGLGLNLLLVIVLGAISYWQTNQIHKQMVIFYEHPVTVRRAISELKVDIYKFGIETRDLVLSKTENERIIAIENSDLDLADALVQIDLLRKYYLGPKSDVDSVYNSFTRRISLRDENLRLIKSGNLEDVIERINNGGLTAIYDKDLFSKIKIIDDFAFNKTNELYQQSEYLNSSLNSNLIILVIIIGLVVILIHYLFISFVIKPVEEIKDVAIKFREGDFSKRSNYLKGNEVGDLALSFNKLANRIQRNNELNDKKAHLSSALIIEHKKKEFFELLINELCKLTDSNIAAIYLLNDLENKYQLFDSVGLDKTTLKEFFADNPIGEFSVAIHTKQIQNITNIHADNIFILNTVSASIVPKEIIAIPIFSNNKIIALISLASIAKYSNEANKLLISMHHNLNARIDGVLSLSRISTYNELLEKQNVELEMLSNELSNQASELSVYNEELEQQKNSLKQANQVKNTFLSNMSHELRTPLNSVIALSGVLSRRLIDKINGEEHNYISVIERNGKQLLALINNILDISRIESGREEVEVNEFILSNLIYELVEMINPIATQKNIEIVNHIGNDKTLLKSDFVKCRHILQNIIANAVKFTEKGKVEIFISKNSEGVDVIVKDTGIGISKEQKKHIFDEFRQADGTTSRKYGGTGLGLAIAKRYANLIESLIEVKSVLDSGSEFIVKLKNLEKRTESKSIQNNVFENGNKLFENGKLQDIKNNSGKTILIVEDNEPAVIQLKDILEECGYKIIVAQDGVQAIDLISESIPDAIILDLMLPEIDGFELLATIRNEDLTVGIPVLVLTAKHINKEELKFLKRNKIHQLIQKGDINRKELVSIINSMLIIDNNSSENEISIEKRSNGKQLILIVEDNIDNMITVRALLDEDYIVVEANNGLEAIKIANEKMPDLILMDIGLPEMDGITSFKTIRNNPKTSKIPIIAITASAMNNERETILALGFEAYLSKPIDSGIFFKVIKEVLYGR